MATPQLSPGVLVREVDLTVGRADNVLDNIGAIAGPFSQGPVEEITDITTEQELINIFGKPLSTDNQFEYWMSASSFLSYGGVLKVVRNTDTNLRSANAGVGVASDTSAFIKNRNDYEINYSEDAVEFFYAARSAGSWADNLKVCQIDDAADQRIFIDTTNLAGAGFTVGFAVTAQIPSGTAFIGLGKTSSENAVLKGVITGVSTSTVSPSFIDVKIVARTFAVGGGSTTTLVDYAEGDPGTSFVLTGAGSSLRINVTNDAGQPVAVNTTTITPLDWYDQQTLDVSTTSLFWKSLAPKPTTSAYVLDRNGRNDGIHIAVIDEFGDVTGVTGNLLEVFTDLSKAYDAVRDQRSVYYKDYIRDNSNYLYVGRNQSSAFVQNVGNLVPTIYPTHTGFTTAGTTTGISLADGLWGLPSQNTTYSAVGNKSFRLIGGKDYQTSGGPGFSATLGDLATAYELFNDTENVEVDYLIMGPGLDTKSQSQAKAQYLISIAGQRKDCMAVISPHRGDVLSSTNTNTQTDNILAFYGPLASSSYAVFDTGYKYSYDRFNNEFRYIPTNADVAGLMVRTSIFAYPWFSPAGQQRGILNNVIKLAYSPTKAQRDRLYPKRINSISTQPGIGTLLFGDKTALGYASAFDRINVRRLFLTIEQSLQRAAQAQLFELNDDITRANFVNIVAPFLRDVQAKRGLYDFLVVCDESNNTPDVIDNNEFRADIFLKPAKSINFVTLTFVATRTGVSFDEVVGRV
jgi:phage tail sheath protein FI